MGIVTYTLSSFKIERFLEMFVQNEHLVIQFLDIWCTYIHICKIALILLKYILYSAKRWRGKSLANLANPEQFAKVLPIQI